MSRPGPRNLLLVIAALVPFAAAGISLGAEGEGVQQTVAPERRWTIHETLADGSLIPVVDGRPVTGGIVDRSYGLARLDPVFDPLDEDGLATAKVFSNETGRTWWLSSESQAGAPGRLGPEVGNSIEFEQLHGFQKVADRASLRLVFTKAFIDALDHNGFVLPSECVAADTDDEDLCSSLMWGDLGVYINAWTADGSLYYRAHGDIHLEGRQGDWTVYPNLDSQFGYRDIWTETAFEIDKDVDDDGGLHARARLRAPVVVDIPLNGLGHQVDDQEIFALQIHAEIESYNTRGRESWLAVYLRDPVETGGSASGATIELTGLTPTDDFPREPPPEVVPTPAPCPAPSPNAGILRLEVTEPRALEMHGALWHGVISRTGGASGDVSATLTTLDGTAIAGTDYEALQTWVAFADGDTTPQRLALPVVADQAIEPDETLRLALSEPGGCATLDDGSSVELTILDDDAPVAPPAAFTVGGTVSGLIGTGLVLQDHHGLFLEIFENGPFTFADLPSPAGTDYAVSVFNQPRDPSQSCTVSNGTGTFADTNVTDVQVSCV
jgi:hypothetical protein